MPWRLTLTAGYIAKPVDMAQVIESVRRIEDYGLNLVKPPHSH